jgi:hypothetical protein
VAAGADHAVPVEARSELFVGGAEHHPDAHAQLVFVGHRLESVDGREGRTGILE